MNNSIWIQECEIGPFPQLENDLKTDVLIIGGGLAGVLCAYNLQKQGIPYTLIESGRICHGVTCGTTAKITSQHGLIYHKLIRQFGVSAARKYWEANEWAVNQFRLLSQSRDCEFKEIDHIIYSAEGENKLAEEIEALRLLEIPAVYVADLELPFQAGGILFPKQAQFHPLKFVSNIVGDLNLYEHTPACKIEGNVVQTPCGKITAEKIIVATHFPVLNKHGGFFLKLYQERSYVVALENAPLYKRMYRDAEKSGFSFRNYRDYLIVGGGSHRTGKKGSGWKELEFFQQKYYPDSKIVARWANQDCITLDGLPYIGRYSKNTPNLYVATGFNKWGMTSAMLASNILVDLIQGNQNPLSFLFEPSRSICRPQLACNIAESALNLVTPTVPRCPHMGCALKWNKFEHSWDCPCHGSRFSKDGEVLNHPAVSNLKDNQST